MNSKGLRQERSAVTFPARRLSTSEGGGQAAWQAQPCVGRSIPSSALSPQWSIQTRDNRRQGDSTNMECHPFM
jgi:hypothetical protein